MAKVYNKLSLDVRKKNNDIVTAIQNDSNSRYLDVVLTDRGHPINLTGHTVRLFAKKPDKTEVMINGVIKDNARGRVEFLMTTQLISAIGSVETQIVLFKNNIEILSSFPFKIFVTESLLNNSTVPSTNEYGSLVVLFQDLYEARTLMQNILDRVGVPNSQILGLSITNMFEAFHYIIRYLENNSSAGVNDKLERVLNVASLLQNSSYGLNALKQDIARSLNDTKGDIFKRQLYIARQTVTKPSGTRTFNRQLLNLSFDCVITWIEFTARYKQQGNYATIPIEIRVGSNLFNFSSVSNTLNMSEMQLLNRYCPLASNSIQFNVNSTQLPNDEIEMTLNVYYYR